MLRIAVVCAGTAACASAATAVFADASAAPEVACTGIREPTTIVRNDPDSGCPTLLSYTHRWRSTHTCDHFEPGCSVAPNCRFQLHVTAPALAGCARAGVEATFPVCRCEFGVVECPSAADPIGDYPGCVANNVACYDCGN